VNEEKLADQLEHYSKAIVTFVVLQAVAFMFSFGTIEFFNCLVLHTRYLAGGLIAHFAIVTALSSIALAYLGWKAAGFAKISRKTIVIIYVGKLVAIVLFTALPIMTMVKYGMIDDVLIYQCSKPNTAK